MDDKSPTYTATHGKLSKPEKGGNVGWLEGAIMRWYGAKGSWKARKDDPHEKPLVEMVEAIGKKLRLKKTPLVYLYESENPEMVQAPNGRIVFSTALLNTLTPDEVKSMVAHQLVRQSHILRDAAVITFIGAGELGFEAAATEPMHHLVEKHITTNPKKQIALMIAEKLVTLSAARGIENYYDRSCVFEADREGAKITGQPKHMISAIEKVEDAAQNYELKERAKMSSWRQKFENFADKYEPQWIHRVRKTWNPMEILNSEPPSSSRVKALKILAQNDSEHQASPALSHSR